MTFVARKPKARIATSQSPWIASVIEGSCHFADEATALKRLEAIKRQFILSKHQPAQDYPRPACILWVKAYEVTEEEAAQGYLGHYAILTVELPNNKGRSPISITKLPSELAMHPQKKRPKTKHPDWGFHVLRGVQQGRHYLTSQEGQQQLEMLHDEFPDTSILCTHKLYTIIYRKADNPRDSIQKWVLTVEPTPEGTFTIKAAPNNYKKPSTLKPGESTEIRPLGYFTAKAQLGKKPGKPAETA
ncbi:hypothetical protein GC177_01960 [bacterium]|nr:hypothetical protein [bacterium]